MTKEHVIGELYLKFLELSRAHQSVLVENEKLKSEATMLETIVKQSQKASSNELPKIRIDEQKD